MGYYNHFEIGWIVEKYTELAEEARNIGIKSPETYYRDGKEKGKSSRGQIIEGKRSSIEADKPRNNGIIQSDINRSGSNICSITDRPKLNDPPGMIEKISAIDLPELLNGSKLFRRK